jgi:hypothetical protein
MTFWRNIFRKVGDVDGTEAEQTLAEAYDLRRGTASDEEAQAMIDRLRRYQHENHFAENIEKVMAARRGRTQ